MTSNALVLILGGVGLIATLFVLAAYLVDRRLDQRWKDEGESP